MDEVFGQNTEQIGEAGGTIEGIVSEADPLKLELDDDSFVKVMNSWISESRKFFGKQDLYKRRRKNEEYYLGQEIKNLEKKKELKPYQTRYMDNVIFEAEGTLKAVAVSRVPDLIVKPGNDSPDSKDVAEDLSEVINSSLRKRENRTVLGRAYKHRPIYFTGVIKAIWDDEDGKNGNYRFECIHPDNIDIDHTATSNDTDSMNWTAHHYDLTAKEIIMRWPDKKAEFLRALGYDNLEGSEEEKLASTVRISEIWFRWYKKEGDKWERVEGTAWKYKHVVFDKIKNPYWDWEGETTAFTFDSIKDEKRELTEQDIRTSIMTGQTIPGVTTESVYFNYFKDPRKPFYFMGYDQLGKQPMDETSRIEQALYLQDSVNTRGRQISDLASGAKGKNVFSTESGLTKADIQRIDMGNYDQDLLVDGNLREVHTFIPGTLPTPALFQEQNINRERAFSKLGTNAALRGVREGPDPATKTQLFKESDYTRIDDEVEDTINAAAEWMAEWAMQFIKMFYTEEHMVSIVGSSGKLSHMKLSRDMIEDGMEVEVSASSVDKLRRRREAYELAGIGMIDPVQFYKDIEASDPEGRAAAYMLFSMSPNLYYQKYIEGNETTQDMINALGQQPPTGQPPSPEAQAVTPPEEGLV